MACLSGTYIPLRSRRGAHSSPSLREIACTPTPDSSPVGRAISAHRAFLLAPSPTLDPAEALRHRLPHRVRRYSPLVRSILLLYAWKVLCPRLLHAWRAGHIRAVPAGGSCPSLVLLKRTGTFFLCLTVSLGTAPSPLTPLAIGAMLTSQANLRAISDLRWHVPQSRRA